MVLQPASHELSLQDRRAGIDPGVAEEALVAEDLMRIATLGDPFEHRAPRPRRSGQRPEMEAAPILILKRRDRSGAPEEIAGNLSAQEICRPL